MIFLINILIWIAIALSMDTFSLALSLGTMNLSYKKVLFYPLLVGVFHFIFPLIGRLLGDIILNIIIIGSQKLLGLIFLILFLKLLYDMKKGSKDTIKISKISLILLAISVSLDSLTTGIGLNAITKSILLPSLIFQVVSTTFTFLGLLIGAKASNSLGNIANYFGLLILLILTLAHLCK